jgi:hypothetical protein
MRASVGLEIKEGSSYMACYQNEQERRTSYYEDIPGLARNVLPKTAGFHSSFAGDHPQRTIYKTKHIVNTLTLRRKVMKLALD